MNFDRREMIVETANFAISKAAEFNENMERVLTPFCVPGSLLKGCKFGNTPLTTAKYNHGLFRAEMKYLEELASKELN